MPQNTGNIGRTCAATGSALHLIRPLGFFLGEKNIRRAGLDYWNKLDLTVYDNYQDFLSKNPGAVIYMATTKAERTYCDVRYTDGCFILFGKESAGIPEELLVANRERCVRIPMLEDTRSLNLASSAAIITYEALRQQGFAGLEPAGELHRLRWE